MIDIDKMECIEWIELWCPGMHGPSECQVQKAVQMTVGDAIKAQKTIAGYNGYFPSDFQALKEFMDNHKAYYV